MQCSLPCAVQFIEWMVQTIKTSGVTLLLVTHDRAFLEDTCTAILELDEGRGFVHQVGGHGGYERYRQRRAERRKAQAKLAQDARVCATCLPRACMLVISPCAIHMLRMLPIGIALFHNNQGALHPTMHAIC